MKKLTARYPSGRDSILVVGTIVAALACAWPTQILGQAGPDTRWLPWFGCWQPADDPLAESLVCIRAGGAGVDVSTVAGARIVSTHRLVADGQRYEQGTDTCRGWQSAAFSSDGQRVYLRSERTCEDGTVRTASAVMAMSTEGEWIDAQAIGLEGERTPRVVRYQPAESMPPAEFAITPDEQFQVDEARIVASMRLTLADVREAARSVDPEALEVFLVERDQAFQLDAGGLVGLAEAGVSDDVIDVVVALSYPDRFEISRGGEGPDLRPRGGSAESGYGTDHYGSDPYGWGPHNRGSYSGCGLQSFYRSSLCYGYGYGGYGGGLGWYSPYGYGYGYPGRAIIILRGQGDEGVARDGQVVKGRGYTRSTSSGSDTPRRAVQNTRRRGSQPASSGRGSSASGRRGSTASKGGYTRSGSRGSSGSSSGKAKPRRRS